YRHHAGKLDAGVAQLTAHGLGEADHRVLRSRVGRDPGDTRLSGRGGHVDDVPAIASQQALAGELGADDDAVDVDVELALDRIVGLLGERRYRHDPGVVDDDLERAELALGGVEEAGEGAAIGDVKWERDGAAPQLTRRALSQLEVEVADRDAAALAHQR